MDAHSSSHPFLPPGGLLEIVFSFDTTGSMSSILEEVQGRLQDMIQRLQADIPGIRIGVIAHGDYCDKDVFYLTKQYDLSTNISELCDFIKDVGGTGGGDQDECYELILRMVRETFSWTPLSNKVLVIIGDANPHEPDYEMNEAHIDWRDEVQELRRSGVKIYGVQAFDNEDVDLFYRKMSEETEGQYLKLDNFQNICDFLMAICYRERGEDFLLGYEAEVRSRHGRMGLQKDLEGMFGTLKRGDSSSSTLSLSKIKSTFAVPTPCSPLPPSTTTKDTTLTMPPAHALPVPVAKAVKKRVKKVTVSTTSKKVNKGEVHKRKKPKQKMFRENIKQSDFALKNLQWSPWKLAFTSSNSLSERVWVKPSKSNSFSKKIQIFSDVTRKTGLYEVSVQTKFRGKRHVVFHSIVPGAIHRSFNRDWAKFVFGKTGMKCRIMRQIERVVNQGCKVFVRRALLTKRKVPQLENVKTYSYVWNKYPRQKYRGLLKDDIIISHENGK